MKSNGQFREEEIKRYQNLTEAENYRNLDIENSQPTPIYGLYT